MAGREVPGTGAELGPGIASLASYCGRRTADAAARHAVLPSKRLSLKQRMADHTQEILYAKVEDP